MKYYSSESHKLLLDHAKELDYEDCLCLIILDPISNIKEQTACLSKAFKISKPTEICPFSQILLPYSREN